MASGGGPQWVWDANRQDYYYVTQDQYSGNLIYHWQHGPSQVVPHASNPTTAGASQYSVANGGYSQPSTTAYNGGYGATSVPSPLTGRSDSVTGPGMPDPAPTEVRAWPRFIPGTPERGWYEKLDSSYRMRTGAEIHQFFRIGKVFSMLHIQAASEDALRRSTGTDTITLVRYGQHAFSQIRRFVVVEVRRGFVYACPITTYSGRGCLKQGCVASEHSAVYVRGSSPRLFPREYEAGLTKDAICIVPVDSHVVVQPASRLHYCKAYPIEMNVKVKEIGDVDPDDVSNLLRYYQEENGLLPVRRT